MNSGRLPALMLGLLLALNCGGKPKVSLPPPTPARVGAVERGVASWYGNPYHGRRTSNGETYDMDELTAAHLSLPFDTRVRVKNRNTGKSIEVRINDRGPFVDGRIIDLSREAARRIGMLQSGIAPVEVRVVAGPDRPLPPLQPSPADLQDAPCVSQRHYGVQVGSFRELLNAQRMRGKMAHDYGEGRIYEAETDGRVSYRVVVGRFGAAAAAREMLARLGADGFEGFVKPVPQALAEQCL